MKYSDPARFVATLGLHTKCVDAFKSGMCTVASRIHVSWSPDLAIESWVEAILECPRDGGVLTKKDGTLKCPDGHLYPIIEGIPVMLVEEAIPTHGAITESLNQASSESPKVDFYLGSERVHPFVLNELVRTCGNMYRSVKIIRKYPIPQFPITPPTERATLVDLGSNWGRWSLSAARNGFRVVGIDPSLNAALTGKRIALQLGLPVSFVVGDARFLPFKSESLDVAFSYSVLQHFSKSDALQAIGEASRVLHSGSTILVQMANARGIRQLFNQLRQRLRGDDNPFRVRYWTIRQLKETFEQIGPTSISADGYLSLNAQISDVELLPKRYASIIRLSEGLKKLADRWPVLTEVADSVWVKTRIRSQGFPQRPAGTTWV